MIDFGRFRFYAPPRTGSTWFCQAAALSGFHGTSRNAVHVPPPEPDSVGVSVSLVRSPWDWLTSYYLSLQGGHIGIQVVDVLADAVKRNLSAEKDLDYFVDYYLEAHPGQITRIFQAYTASTVLRVEDFPDAPIEFFEMNRGKVDGIWKFPPANCRKGLPVRLDQSRISKLRKTESLICDHYDY